MGRSTAPSAGIKASIHKYSVLLTQPPKSLHFYIGSYTQIHENIRKNMKILENIRKYIVNTRKTVFVLIYIQNCVDLHFFWVCSPVFRVSGLVFWVTGPRSRPGTGPRAGPGTGPGTGPWAAPGPGQGQAKGQALRCLRQTSEKRAPQKKQDPIYLEMCSFTCLGKFSLNFANIASPAEMTITTSTASKFCAKRCTVQPPIFFLELISLVTTGITEPWPECQPFIPLQKTDKRSSYFPRIQNEKPRLFSGYTMFFGISFVSAGHKGETRIPWEF